MFIFLLLLISLCFFFFFFFFQAEDGIRDGTVTAVQTCALPIYLPGRADARAAVLQSAGARLCPLPDAGPRPLAVRLVDPSGWRDHGRERPDQIGRASCRERV